MSHSTVLVVIPGSAPNAEAAESMLEDLLEPFNENRDMTPYPVWEDEETVTRAVQFYRDNPDHCGEDAEGPIKPFEEYVTEGNLEAWHEWTRQAVGAYCRSDRDDGIYDAEGDRYGYMSTYNPDSRWDWWTLGGRWHGYFMLKPTVPVGATPTPEWRKAFEKELRERYPNNPETHEANQALEAFDPEKHQAKLGLSGTGGDDPNEHFGGRADLARKRDIDIEGMRVMAAMEADAAYEKYLEATEGIEPAPRWDEHRKFVFVERGLDPEATMLSPDLSEEEREQVKAQFGAAMNEARASYREHPWVKALQEAGLSSWFGENRDIWCVDDGGRETYIERARSSALTTFAVLKDGVWHEQGKMGWFGMASDEKDPDLWNREFARMLDTLPDDTWLAVVDVHI